MTDTKQTLDPVELTAQLIRCPSVTPQEGGALALLEETLSEAGFSCTFVNRGNVTNLFARWGKKDAPRRFGFNGHTDVVPIGNEADWSTPPFGAQIKDGRLLGRGACDMKSGVAAFVCAAIEHVHHTPPEGGAIVLAITGDEEAEAIDGTRALLDWMDETGESMSVCLVGEPTSPNTLGDMMKIGRRGSLTTFIEMTGKQGHCAYPHRANNPINALIRLLHYFTNHTLDEGSAHFDPSTLAVLTVDTGNPATNVIPATTRATINIRFNDLHSSDALIAWIETAAQKIDDEFKTTTTLRHKCSGESFITSPGAFSKLISDAVHDVTTLRPELSTSGGTSDARFVQAHCPVVEFGLVGDTMHAVDESVDIADIHALTHIYSRLLTRYFET